MFYNLIIAGKAKVTKGDGIIESKVAAAILLVSIIKADGLVHRNEFAQAIKILSARFDMNADEIGHLLESASDSKEAAHDLKEFAVHLQKNWDQTQKLELLDDFWQIAISDQIIDSREVELIARLAGLLGLAEETIIQSRKRAESKLNKLGN